MSFNSRQYLAHEEHRLAFPEEHTHSGGYRSQTEPTWVAVAKIAAEMREKYGEDEMRRMNEEFEKKRKFLDEY